MKWQDESVKMLAASQRGDGGWSYYAQGDSAVEPTAEAVAALWVMDAEEAARKKGLAFLAGMCNADGDLRPQPSQTDGTTIAAIAGTVMAACGGDKRLAVKVADRLLSIEPETAPKTTAIADDPSLHGFSWLPRTYSWVEPTGYGLILMHHVGKESHPRWVEARNVLLDRAVRTGGWNYGNSRVFGSDLEPQPMTSAVALLGLWGETESDVVKRGVEYLRKVQADVPSALSLGWVAMALRARGNEDVKAERFGDLLAGSERSSGSAWHRAVALLAAGPVVRNPFVIGNQTKSVG